MTTDDYLRLQKTAYEMIQSFSGGSTVSLLRPNNNGGEDVVGKGIPITFDKRLIGFFNTTGGNIVAHEGDVIYMPFTSFKAVPQVADILAYGNRGKQDRVQTVSVLRPDNRTYILFTLTVT